MVKDYNPDIDLINFQPSEFLAFKDMEVCKRVAKIKKEDLTKPPGDFVIIESLAEDLKIELTG